MGGWGYEFFTSLSQVSSKNPTRFAFWRNLWLRKRLEDDGYVQSVDKKTVDVTGDPQLLLWVQTHQIVC